MPSDSNKGTIPIIFLLGESINVEKEKADPSEAWRFYSSSIKKYPNDLRLHTHRIFFAISYKDTHFLAGALHDLFIVLEDAGEPLRVRLLKAAYSHLKETEAAYLVKWIKSNDKKQMGASWVAGSVLSKGLIDVDNNLVTMEQREQASTNTSPLEEARSCIEYGQLEMAETILQEALIDKEMDTNEKETLQEELNNLQHHLNKHKETEEQM